jgi:hypothetical protein
MRILPTGPSHAREPLSSAAAPANSSPPRPSNAPTWPHRRLRKLVDRGRRSGDFRTDVSAEWLVTAFHALIHAAGDARAGRMRAGAALSTLRLTMRDLFSARSPEKTAANRGRRSRL